MIQPTIQNTYGSALVGLVVSATLYGATILQTYFYYRHYPKDRALIKILVLALWALDTAHLVLCTIAMYWYLITNFSHLDALSRLTWSMELQTDLNGLIALLVECFFARRVWIMSSNVYLTSVIVLLACVHFGTEVQGLVSTGVLTSFSPILGFGIVFTVESFHFNTVADFTKLVWVTSAGIGSALAADLLIAISLCYYLAKSRTGFKRTDSLIYALMIYSLSTGLLTSVFGLAILVTVRCLNAFPGMYKPEHKTTPTPMQFATMPDNYVWLAFFWIDGRCYVNSLLAALNSREHLRGKAHDGSFLQLSAVPRSTVATDSRVEPYSPFRSRPDASPLAVTIQTDTVFKSDFLVGSVLGSPSGLATPSSVVHHL